MDRQALQRRITEVLDSTDDGLVACYLYGSTARGTDRPQSDVDLGILLASAPPGALNDFRSHLEGDLERVLGRRAQVVVLNHAPADLIHRVLCDGVLLVDRDRSARIRFEVRARNEYFDLLPILNRYRGREAASR